MNSTTYVPERLYLIQVAALPSENNMPVVSYLVQTSDGTNILIDSGIPNPEHLPPNLPELHLYPNVIDQLALIDIQPEDIDVVISTHFDLDHVGLHPAFSGAQFVVQRTHYEIVRDHPRFAPTAPFWNQPALQYRLIEGDTELLPGVELIETSGHVPGHQSVLVRLPESGPVLLTIDAVPDRQSFTPERPPNPRDLDPAGSRASTRKLLDLAEREELSLVIFGHDGEQWQSLKKLPDFYS